MWAQVRHLTVFLASYKSTFFPLLFPPILQLLFPSMPLFTNIGQAIIFPLLKTVFETVYLKLGFKPTWQGLCALLGHSVMSGMDSHLAKTHGAWFQDLMKLRFLASHCRKNSVRDTVKGKRLICSNSERSTVPLCHHRGCMKCVVSFCKPSGFIC